MISLSTAKLFLFIALLLGPKGGDTIEIVNDKSYCVWEQESNNWKLTELGQTSPKSPFTGTTVTPIYLQKAANKDFQLAHEISSHNWAKDSVLNLPNGDVVEKQGTKIFYTVNAGGANQQIYTILTMADGKTL